MYFRPSTRYFNLKWFFLVSSYVHCFSTSVSLSASRLEDLGNKACMKLFLRLTVFDLSSTASILFLTEWLLPPVLPVDPPVDGS